MSRWTSHPLPAFLLKPQQTALSSPLPQDRPPILLPRAAAFLRGPARRRDPPPSRAVVPRRPEAASVPQKLRIFIYPDVVPASLNRNLRGKVSRPPLSLPPPSRPQANAGREKRRAGACGRHLGRGRPEAEERRGGGGL